MGMPWDGLVSDDDMRRLTARSGPLDREPTLGSKPALIVVDLTRTFVRDGYPLHHNETGGREAVQANIELLATARSVGIPIFFTKALRGSMTGGKTSAEGGRRKGQSPTLFVTPEGLPDGNVVAEELDPQPNETIVGKAKASGFFGTALQSYLNLFDVDTVIVTGMTTSGCVRATALDADALNYHVVIPHQACADYAPAFHQYSLLDMHVKYCEVLDLDVVQRYLVDLPATA